MSSGSNGDRRPPRPRIEMVRSPASPAEAAAVIAAIERFIAETAPAPRTAASRSRWQRAALLEGVRENEAASSPWGPGRDWG